MAALAEPYPTTRVRGRRADSEQKLTITPSLFFAITSTNAGGHIAHIGGALFGMWFASRIRNGKDLTAPMNRLIDWFVNLGKRKPKMRVTYKRNETDYEYNARKHQESVDLDTILDKLKRSGYESLSAEEKKRLFDASKK